MKGGVIVAMESELAALRAAGVTMVEQSGIGKVNAARTATEMILRSHPDFIINSGVAGGMDPRLRNGDFVVGEVVGYHDVWCGEGSVVGQVHGYPLLFPADPKLLAAAHKLENSISANSPETDPIRTASPHIHFGLLASGDQFFVSMEEDERIRSVHPQVLAADMESAAIAQVCHHYGVPFLSFRAISDVHGSVEEQKSSYADFWQNVSDNSFRLVTKLMELLG